MTNPRLSQDRPQLRVVSVPTLADLLRRRRRALGWTQEQLATEMGVRAQTVSSWECGKRPQRRFSGRIAAFLGVDTAMLESLYDPSLAFADDGEPEEADASLDEPLRDYVLRAVAYRVATEQELSESLLSVLDRLLVAVDNFPAPRL